jgi:hypothetical protein
VGTANDATNRRRVRIDNEPRRQKVEKARKLMFTEGLAIKSARVKRILGDNSLVPTRVSPYVSERIKSSYIVYQNAFSDKMSMVGQDYHHLFVVDLLHEFEIGIWKSVLTHLIRILHASPGGDGRVTDLNTR